MAHQFLITCKVSSETLARSNKVYVKSLARYMTSDSQTPVKPTHFKVQNTVTDYYMIFEVAEDDCVEDGFIALNARSRTQLQIALKFPVRIIPMSLARLDYDITANVSNPSGQANVSSPPGQANVSSPPGQANVSSPPGPSNP